LHKSSLALKTIIDEKNYHLPIIHSEADYKQFVLLGDTLQIKIFLEKISQHTFTLNYTLLNKHSQLLDPLVARAQTVHISIEKKSLNKIELPEEVRQLFV